MYEYEQIIHKWKTTNDHYRKKVTPLSGIKIRKIFSRIFPCISMLKIFKFENIQCVSGHRENGYVHWNNTHTQLKSNYFVSDDVIRIYISLTILYNKHSFLPHFANDIIKLQRV